MKHSGPRSQLVPPTNLYLSSLERLDLEPHLLTKRQCTSQWGPPALSSLRAVFLGCGQRGIVPLVPLPGLLHRRQQGETTRIKDPVKQSPNLVPKIVGVLGLLSTPPTGRHVAMTSPTWPVSVPVPSTPPPARASPLIPTMALTKDCPTQLDKPILLHGILSFRGQQRNSRSWGLCASNVSSDHPLFSLSSAPPSCRNCHFSSVLLLASNFRRGWCPPGGPVSDSPRSTATSSQSAAASESWGAVICYTDT